MLACFWLDDHGPNGLMLFVRCMVSRRNFDLLELVLISLHMLQEHPLLLAAHKLTHL